MTDLDSLTAAILAYFGTDRSDAAAYDAVLGLFNHLGNVSQRRINPFLPAGYKP